MDKEEFFEQICPKCHRTNKVVFRRRNGFSESQEYFCAYCGFELGQVNASETPETEIVEEPKNKESRV